MSTRVSAVSRLLWKGQRRKCGSLAGVMVKREPTRITVEDVNFAKPTGDIEKVPKSVKQTGAWQYPGGIIQRATHLQGRTNRIGEPYTDDKDPGEARRKHESNFFITLNTNRYVGEGMPGGVAQQAKQAVVEALNVLAEDESLCTYLKFGPKNAEHYGNDRFADVVTKVEWQAAVETGENLGRLHCHIWLTVHHASQVQVNMPVMQKMFKDLYNAEAPASMRIVRGKPYIQVKLLPSSDWATVMKQYIHKGMRAV
jgi:hypothetical protein